MIYRTPDPTPATNYRQRLALTYEEAADALGVSRRQIERLVGNGVLRPSRAFGRPLLSVSQLERLAEGPTPEGGALEIEAEAGDG